MSSVTLHREYMLAEARRLLLVLRNDEEWERSNRFERDLEAAIARATIAEEPTDEPV